MSYDEMIFLPDVPAELAAQGLLVTYPQCWMATVRGVVRYRMVHGRLMIHRADLPLLAAALKGKSDKNVAKAAGL